MFTLISNAECFNHSQFLKSFRVLSNKPVTATSFLGKFLRLTGNRAFYISAGRSSCSFEINTGTMMTVSHVLMDCSPACKSGALPFILNEVSSGVPMQGAPAKITQGRQVLLALQHDVILQGSALANQIRTFLVYFVT